MAHIVKVIWLPDLETEEGKRAKVYKARRFCDGVPYGRGGAGKNGELLRGLDPRFSYCPCRGCGYAEFPEVSAAP